MSDLLRLKKWLPLEAAALRLSSAMNESVTVADVLQLALDDHIRLSVHLVNPAYGRLIDVDSGASGDQSRVIALGGVLDVPLIGDERADVERMLQELIGGPTVDRGVQRGSFLANAEDPDELWRIYDRVQPKPLTKAQARGIVTSDGRKYVPSPGLPVGSLLVMRAGELQRFLATMGTVAGASIPSVDRVRERILQLAKDHLRGPGEAERFGRHLDTLEGLLLLRQVASYLPNTAVSPFPDDIARRLIDQWSDQQRAPLPPSEPAQPAEVVPGTARSGQKKKLTDAQQKEVARRLAAGETQVALARAFKVSRPTIADCKPKSATPSATSWPPTKTARHRVK